MSAIERCRTAALGGHVARCQDCAYTTIAYNSCRNRHCPKCQGAAAKQWLAEREAELLPVPYFHLVFTLPARIAAIAYQNKAVVYDLLFRAAADTVLTIAADPKHLGARIGITAVLHTWGSTMTHHPHLHMIVPGGGISLDGSRWLSCRPGFFLPVPVFSKLFCGLMLAKLLAAHKAGQLKFFGQHASRTTNHRRQPSPSGSIPHDRDYWIATPPPRSRLLLVLNRLPSRSLNCAVRPSTQACNRHTQPPSQPSIPAAVASLSPHCSRHRASRSFAHTFRLSQIPITEAAAPPPIIARGFVPWRLSDAGHRVRGSVDHGRHPKPCAKADPCIAANRGPIRSPRLCYERLDQVLRGRFRERTRRTKSASAWPSS